MEFIFKMGLVTLTINSRGLNKCQGSAMPTSEACLPLTRNTSNTLLLPGWFYTRPVAPRRGRGGLEGQRPSKVLLSLFLKVYFCRGKSIQGLVWPIRIVLIQIFANSLPGISRICIFVYVYFLVLHRPP